MKKLIAAILAMVMVLSLVACGAETKEDTSSDIASTTDVSSDPQIETSSQNKENNSSIKENSSSTPASSSSKKETISSNPQSAATSSKPIETVDNIEKLINECFKWFDTCVKIKLESDSPLLKVVAVLPAGRIYMINQRDHNEFNIVLTEDGELYEFTLREKTFSNGKKYRKIETDLRFVSYISSGFFVTKDLKIYVAQYDGNGKYSFKETLGYNDYYKNYFQYCNDPKAYFGTYEYGFYHKNNNVYNVETNELFHSFPTGEKIEGVGGGFIKTNKAYYLFTKVIEQEFADSEPVEKLVMEKKDYPLNLKFAHMQSVPGGGIQRGPDFVVHNNYLYYLPSFWYK